MNRQYERQVTSAVDDARHSQATTSTNSCPHCISGSHVKCHPDIAPSRKRPPGNFHLDCTTGPEVCILLGIVFYSKKKARKVEVFYTEDTQRLPRVRYHLRDSNNSNSCKIGLSPIDIEANIIELTKKVWNCDTWVSWVV